MEIGIDIIDIARFEKLQSSQTFLEKYFTASEVDYCNNTVNKTMRMAGIFCAKEAFVKAVGSGIGGCIKFKDINIGYLDSGKPILTLSSDAQLIAQGLGFENFKISISHTDTTSTAVCLIY